MLRKTFFYILVSSIITIAIVNIDFYGMFHKRIPQQELVPVVVHSAPIINPEPVVAFSNIDTDSVECMATNMYHEARGEGELGKIAVGFVTYNRMMDPRFPDNICDVVYQARYSKWWLEEKGRLVPIRYQCQFTWYCDGLSDRIDKTSVAWRKSVELSILLLSEKLSDPTDGATHYFNHNLVNPRWSRTMSFVTRIKNHSFYH